MTKPKFKLQVSAQKVLLASISSLSVATTYANDIPQATASSILMEEVLVTAQKKGIAEDSQQVPIAITAHTGEQLEAIFVESLIDVAHLSPNVSFDVNQSTPGFQSFYIRGTGISSSTLSTDPAVGVFIDGMYVGVPAGVVTDTFDLQSIEVLRGPQGTLFGRNVTGGAVSLTTQRPSDEFGFRARAIAGSDDRYEFALSLTGGLTENTAGKITVFYKDRDHSYDNLAPADVAPDADDVGGREMQAIRPSLSIDFSDDVNLTLLAEVGEMTHTVGARQLVDNDDLVAGLVRSSGLPFPTNNDVSLEYTPELDSEWYHLIADLTWQLKVGSLKSITAYRDFEQNWASDADGSALWVFRSGEDSEIEQDQFSQEFIYNVSFSERTDLTTGLYYFEQTYTSLEERLFGPAFGSGTDYSDATVDHSTYGIFAQADIDILDSLTLTLGGRYTVEDKEVDISQFGGDCVGGFSSCVPSVNDDDEWSNFSPKVALRWQISDDVQTYLSYTRGFRSGGFNIRSTNDSYLYDEEEVDAFELGLKSLWWDGRARLNAALFYNEISDMQRNVNIPGSSVGGAQALLNAAEATIQGVEVEGHIAPIDNLLISYQVGWMDAEYDKYENLDVTGDGVPDPALATRLDLPRVPEWTTGLGITYDIPLSAGLIVLRGDYSYVDSQYFDDRNLLQGPQYELFGASARFQPADANWSVTVFGRNLKDKRYYTGGFETSNWDFWDLGARRSWGIEFTWQS